MKLKRSTEDYLKIIYILSMKNEVRGAAIAEVLGVSRPTVSIALKALEKEGYLLMDENHIVHLTEHGRTIAMEIYERHITLQQLLEELGVDKSIAEKDACEMEHTVSPESFQALKKLAKQKQIERVENAYDD